MNFSRRIPLLSVLLLSVSACVGSEPSSGAQPAATAGAAGAGGGSAGKAGSTQTGGTGGSTTAGAGGAGTGGTAAGGAGTGGSTTGGAGGITAGGAGGSAGGSGACLTGELRCNGDTPESCDTGAWVPGAACSAATVCSNGKCTKTRVSGGISVGAPAPGNGSASYRLREGGITETKSTCGTTLCVKGGFRR